VDRDLYRRFDESTLPQPRTSTSPRRSSGTAGIAPLPGTESVLDPGAAAALETPVADSTPDIIDGVALARLYGEPLFKLPEDLYIPPDALEVFLEAFEGPLDLLLYLIRKQHFNVLDIPMAPLTSSTRLHRTRSAQEPGTRRRVPADGGAAHRDQVAHAAAGTQGPTPARRSRTRAPNSCGACSSTSR